jgi:hypothetical protein
VITVGLGSAMNFLDNQIFLSTAHRHGLVSASAEGQSFGYMALYGMNNGTIPILSYNLSAGNTDRVKKIIRLAFIVALVISLMVMTVVELIPSQLLYLFSASDNMLDIGKKALRICCLFVPVLRLLHNLSSSFHLCVTEVHADNQPLPPDFLYGADCLYSFGADKKPRRCLVRRADSRMHELHLCRRAV